MKRVGYYWIALLVYFAVFIYFALLSREQVIGDVVRLDLFQIYRMPISESYEEILINIVAFVPIGVLAGLIFRPRIVANDARVGLKSAMRCIIGALLVGLLFSLIIEFSQLIWQRGVFDVDDIFNNTLGALIGGVVAVVYMALRKNENGKRSLNE